ncbi:MAG: hypothetical protein RL021_312 [Bacteroidota bacterium]|jgi:hypothetical protein
MFQFKNHSDALPFYHDKLFTLTWDIKGYKWLAIRYVNSQRKRWYRRTERPYRFKRWFFRKAQGSFSNLANFDSPCIELYLFSWYLAWPRKLVIPMRVIRIEAMSPAILVNSPTVTLPPLQPVIRSCSAAIIIPEVDCNLPAPRIDGFNLQVVSQELRASITCDWPVTDWLEKGMVDRNRLDYETLQTLNQTSAYAE